MFFKIVVNNMSTNLDHSRVINTLLGKFEKNFLFWLASKTPPCITSDQMTILGVVSSLFIALFYYLTNYSKYFLWAASFCFILNWIGDSLDGTLARYRKKERPKYGFFIDHTLDVISEMSVFMGIGLSPYINFEYALLALIGYLILSVYVYVKTFVTGIFQLSFGKLGPTEMRVFIIILNAILFYFGALEFSIFSYKLNLLNLVGLFLFIGMLFIFIEKVYVDAKVLKEIDEKNF